MTGLEFLSATIGQLVWPVFIVVLVLLLKEPIKRLAASPRLSKFKAGPGGLELEFNRELDEAEKELGSGEDVKAIESSVSTDESALDFKAEMARLAQVAPRAVVMESHVRLERLLRNSVDVPTNLDNRPRYMSMRSLARAAVSQSILTKQEASVLEELSYLRNRVAHEPDEVITQDTALRYADLTAEVATAVRLANGQTINDGPLL